MQLLSDFFLSLSLSFDFDFSISELLEFPRRSRADCFHFF
jgi:hypothetical protein